MRNLWIIVFFAGVIAATAQVKDDISVVQYSAKFVEANELDLSYFRDYNIQTLHMGSNSEIFKKEGIKFLPTVILYSDGEVILKIESDISLKLPVNCRELIQDEIDLLLEERF